MDYIWLGPKVIQKLFESYYQRGAGHKVVKLLSIRDAIFPAGDHVAGGGGGKGTGPHYYYYVVKPKAESKYQLVFLTGLWTEW